jgi:poly(A) polymerase
LIQYLAKERVHDELVKVFSANNPFGYVALLDEANLLQYIFPSLARCKGNEQPIRYHPFDTYSHIMLTLWNLQKLNTNYLVKL